MSQYRRRGAYYYRSLSKLNVSKGRLSCRFIVQQMAIAPLFGTSAANEKEEEEDKKTHTI